MIMKQAQRSRGMTFLRRTDNETPSPMLTWSRTDDTHTACVNAGRDPPVGLQASNLSIRS